MHRLPERSIAGGIPSRQPYPLFPGCIERDLEPMRPKRRTIRGPYQLPVYFLSISPDQFQELQRIGPLQIGHEGPLRPGSFNREVFEQYFAARDKEISLAQRSNNRTPVFSKTWQAIELQVVHHQMLVGVIVGKLCIGVSLSH